MPEQNIEKDSVRPRKRTWPKTVGISIGGIIITLVIAVSLIPAVISSDRAKNKIINILQGRLNREVQIDDINMSWSSGLEIKNIFIKERADLPGEKFVKVNSIFCDIELFSLIKKRIRISNLIIDSPEIVLQRDTDGSLSYKDIGKTARIIPPPERIGKYTPEVIKKTFEKAKYVPLALPLIFDIKLNARVINGRLSFIDHRTDKETILKDMNTTLNIESLNKPVVLESSFNIEAEDETENAEISLNILLSEDGRINPENASGTFYMKTGFVQMVADFDMARFRGEGGTGLNFLMNADLKDLTGKLAGILALPRGMQMEGTINSKITAEGRLDKNIGIAGNTQIAELSISGGPFGSDSIREPEIRLTQDADIDMVNNRVIIHGIGINSDFANMDITGSVTDFRKGRNLDLRILTDLDMTNLINKIRGLLPEDTEITGKVRSNIKLTGHQDEIEIKGHTGLTEAYVNTADIGPITESEVKITHNARFNLRDKSIMVEKLNIDADLVKINTSGTLNKNADFDLNMLLVAPDIKRLKDNLHGVVSLPEGLGINGKAAAEINLNGNVEKEIKLKGKTILHGINAGGGPLKDVRVSNIDLKVTHMLNYNKTEDYLHIEQLDITSDILNLISKGKISDLKVKNNIDYKLSLNMDLNNTVALFEGLLPADMSMAGNSLIDLGVNGQLSAKDSFPGWYEGLNLNGNISIDAIGYGTNRITGLKSGIHLDDGFFTTKDLAFRLNEGMGNAQLKADLRGEKPALNLIMNLSDVQIDQKMDLFAYIIPALSASEGRVSGALDMTLNAQAVGLDWKDELSKSINAHGNINLENGYIKGDKIISRIIEKEEYRFDNITTDFRIKDEKIYTDDLKIDGKDFDIGLSGWTSFDGKIEYTADAEIIGRYIGGDTEKILGSLGKGTKLPVVITGTINDPGISLKSLTPEEAGTILQEIIRGFNILK